MHTSKLFIIATLFALSGCATTPPIIKVVTQRVEVPVPVACKEITPIAPDYCFIKLKDTDNIYDKVKCLLADQDLSIGYETELLVKFNACKWKY